MNTNKKLEDEIDFKAVFTNPLRMFGWVFIIFLGLLLILGIYFVKNLNDISFNIQPTGLQVDSVNIKKELIVKKGGISPAVDLKLVTNPTPEFVAKGKSLFEANCKSCHGENGMGDGAASATLNPKPRKFHAIDGWTNGRTIDKMYKTLQEGIIKNGMAAFEYLKPEDRFALITYIRTFAEFPPIKEEELSSLDANYQVTKGVITPSQISVSMAENNLVNESDLINQKIIRIKKTIATDTQNSGAEQLKLVSQNLGKIVASFLNSSENSSVDNFIQIVNANPINSGFKPGVVQLSRDKMKLIYDYLKTATL